jgi:hypothetical protein
MLPTKALPKLERVRRSQATRAQQLNSAAWHIPSRLDTGHNHCRPAGGSGGDVGAANCPRRQSHTNANHRKHSGSIEITVDAGWYYDVFSYGERRRDSISGLAPGPYLKGPGADRCPQGGRDGCPGAISVGKAQHNRRGTSVEPGRSSAGPHSRKQLSQRHVRQRIHLQVRVVGM